MWEPGFTVIEIATGACHGPFDTEAEAAAAGLIFAKLWFDRVRDRGRRAHYGDVHRLDSIGFRQQPS